MRPRGRQKTILYQIAQPKLEELHRGRGILLYCITHRPQATSENDFLWLLSFDGAVVSGHPGVVARALCVDVAGCIAPKRKENKGDGCCLGGHEVAVLRSTLIPPSVARAVTNNVMGVKAGLPASESSVVFVQSAASLTGNYSRERRIGLRGAYDMRMKKYMRRAFFYHHTA